MTSHKTVRHFRHADFIAEVEIELHEHPGKEWSPTMSLPDARKLERVRKALERGDLASASRDARVYRLMPIEAA